MGSFLTILGSLGSISATIKAVEGQVPDPGQGPAKLEAVLAILSALNPELASLTAQITPIVGVMVNLFNKTSSWGKQ